MTDEIYKYFMKKYEDCDFQVVPWHWPDFKSQREVDIWIDNMSKLKAPLFEDKN